VAIKYVNHSTYIEYAILAGDKPYIRYSKNNPYGIKLLMVGNNVILERGMEIPQKKD